MFMVPLHPPQNDRPRNEAYRRALQRVVAEEAARLGRKPVVLDIGTFYRLRLRFTRW